jgi:lipoprotein signal peptidase
VNSIVHRGPLNRLAAAAGIVFIADFATKQWALRMLIGEGDRGFTEGWHLAVVNNTHLAGGVASGGLELPITLAATLIMAVLVLRVCQPLAGLDASAPAALGILLGSGAANLADALIPPRGVVDFIGFTGQAGATTSFNIADAALVLGLGLCLRTIWRIALAMRGKIRPRLTTHARFAGALTMRDRLLLSAGHALLAMCGFVWLYSMAIAFTPDAGRSAPNSLLCGVGVFALVFAASQARLRLASRRVTEPMLVTRAVERVVLDGSVAVVPFADAPAGRERPAPRRDIVPGDEDRPRRSDLT